MIFGKTHKEVTEEEQAEREWLFNNPNNCYESFAFLPTKLDSNQTVWLQYYKWKPMVWKEYGYYHVSEGTIYKWV